MFTHGMPSSNAFMTTNGPSVAFPSISNVVLENEIFAYHSGSIPYKLVDIKRRGYDGGLLRKSFIWPLPISLLDIRWQNKYSQ
jgi:hypothetical protein